MFVVYKKKKDQYTLPFLLGSGLVRSDIVLFSVCETQILRHPASSYFGIRLGGRTGHINPKRANCLEIQRLEGLLQIKVF